LTSGPLPGECTFNYLGSMPPFFRLSSPLYFLLSITLSLHLLGLRLISFPLSFRHHRHLPVFFSLVGNQISLQVRIPPPPTRGVPPLLFGSSSPPSLTPVRFPLNLPFSHFQPPKLTPFSLLPAFPPFFFTELPLSSFALAFFLFSPVSTRLIPCVFF